MPHYQKLYTFLFGRITDAIEALQKNETERAKQILISASQEAEEMYITSDPEYAEYPIQPMAQSQFNCIMDRLFDSNEMEMWEAMLNQYPVLAEKYGELSEEECMLLPRPDDIPLSDKSLELMERRIRYYESMAPWELDED